MSKRHLHTHLPSSIITTGQERKQPRCPLTGDGQAQCDLPRSGLLLHPEEEGNPDTATAWMNLENTVLSQMSPSEKDETALLLGTQGTQLHGDEVGRGVGLGAPV